MYDTSLMSLKSKRIIIYIGALLFTAWCIKGYWSGDASITANELKQSLDRANSLSSSLVHEEAVQYGLISTLKEEVSRLRRQLSKCPNSVEEKSPLPTIYAITPTNPRPVQKAELTRLSHTLMLVPNLHWVIVEDSESKTELVANLLARTGMKYTHLYAPTPKAWKLRAKEPRWNKPRGVLQRNAALQWIRDYVSPDTEGVIYFVDDDNSYSLEVFDEMRYLKGVGVWPVGLVGGLMVERPKINSNGKVEGWLTVWSPDRPFAIDMAGFAVNLKLFFQQSDWKFAFEVEKGYQESIFLQHFVKSLDELEVKADNCSKVYVWHTRTEAVNLVQENLLKKQGKRPSNLGIEV